MSETMDETAANPVDGRFTVSQAVVSDADRTNEPVVVGTQKRLTLASIAETSFGMNTTLKIDSENNGYSIEDEFKSSDYAAPRMSVFEAVIKYKGGMVPDPGTETAAEREQKDGKLGTILGVYFPCIQNIIGVIVFIRLPWIIGVAGILETILAILLCCTCTLLTAISMSAIATNGRVPAGGAYYMISRALGPAFGGAVGILFYLANSLSVAMYVIGAVEILIKYICPTACKIFGEDVGIPSVAFNHFRVYGLILLILIGCAVLIGIRFVSIFAPISLFCVLFSILCIYIGIFKAAVTAPKTSVCILESFHLLKSNTLDNNVMANCYPNNSILFNVTCGTGSGLCQFINESNIDQVIPGMSNSQFKHNMKSSYTKANQIAPGVNAIDPKIEVSSQSATSWLLLIGIYFPSVTGIMAGSNRSGDLKNPGKSIPRGTIAAILTTILVYVFLVGSSVKGVLLRDKFGDSINKGLVISQIAWPSKYVILIGALLSTLGAGLQSLTGAPRILQAVAKDDVIPFLHFFSVTSKSGEPRRAVLVTLLISLIGVLIADIDKLTPLLSMFFLLCYGFVNMACALQSLLKAPSWRPNFRFYHWTLSLLGVCICLAIMFMASWYFAIAALVIAFAVYKYIEYKGAEKEWGDGIAGLQLSAARFALSKLEEKEVHAKNWRPELLLFTDIDLDKNEVINETIFAFARQLKAGGGLVIASNFTVTENYLDPDTLEAVKDSKDCIDSVFVKYKVQGFKQVFATKSIIDGYSTGIQCSGMGGMRPNTIVLCWPSDWQHLSADRSMSTITYNTFLSIIRQADIENMALLVPKDVSLFPEKGKVKELHSTIDIWWILHDAGLMILTAHLLKKSKIWKRCPLRIFSVAESHHDAVLAKQYIENFMRVIRIPYNEIEIVVMESSDVSAYTCKEDHTFNTPLEPAVLGNLRRQRRALSRAAIDCQFTFSTSEGGLSGFIGRQNKEEKKRKTHSAMKLNEAMNRYSKNASLIIVNLPPTPDNDKNDHAFMDFVEVLTLDLGAVLLVHGSGRELITSI